MREGQFYEFLDGLSNTAAGARRAVRISNCVFQQIEEGYLPSFSCKDSLCPRCRARASAKLSALLEEEVGVGAAAFLTFTFRASADQASFQREVSRRRSFIVECCKQAGLGKGVLVAEFTCKGERIHLHFHSVYVGSEAQAKSCKRWFDSVGERNCDIQAYNGDAVELAKYFAPVLDGSVGLVMSGCKNLRIRTRYGKWKLADEIAGLNVTRRLLCSR